MIIIFNKLNMIKIKNKRNQIINFKQRKYVNNI